MRKIYKIALILIMVLAYTRAIFADGWVADGYGNWRYEENGHFLTNTTKVIDNVPYYFNHDGYWIEREPLKDVKLKSKEKVTFTIEGKDYEDRKYNVTVNAVMPIVEGKNADAINEFIRKEFQNTITKYLTEYRLNMLFLLPKIDLNEMLEAQNNNGVICFGYFGGGMFNLFLDTKKMEMWAIPNVI